MKFVRLTDLHESTPVYINLELVTTVYAAEHETRIYFDADTISYVKETPEEILKLAREEANGV